MKCVYAIVVTSIVLAHQSVANAQEVGDLLAYELSCISPEFTLGLVQSEPKVATVLLEKLVASGKCTHYRSTMEGIALERVTGVYKDYYKAAIEIWKTTTSRGDQYIVIYHDTTKDGHMFDIKHLTQE